MYTPTQPYQLQTRHLSKYTRHSTPQNYLTKTNRIHISLLYQMSTKPILKPHSHPLNFIKAKWSKSLRLLKVNTLARIFLIKSSSLHPLTFIINLTLPIPSVVRILQNSKSLRKPAILLAYFHRGAQSLAHCHFFRPPKTNKPSPSYRVSPKPEPVSS